MVGTGKVGMRPDGYVEPICDAVREVADGAIRPFTLCHAPVCGSPRNNTYPNKKRIMCVEDMRHVVLFDHVAAEYKENWRNGGNFISSDCLALDLDNDESTTPAEWRTLDHIKEAFPDVPFYAVQSRNYMREKDGKPAAPRWHIYFPIRPVTSADEYARLKKKALKHFPYFDPRAMDAARFFFGVSPAVVECVGGSGYIEDVLQSVPEEEQVPQLEMNRRAPAAKSTRGRRVEPIPAGERNDTLSREAFGRLKRYGDADGRAYDSFMELAKACTPPLDAKEIEEIYRAAVKAYRAKVKTDPDYESPAEYEERLEKETAHPILTLNTARDELACMGVAVKNNLVTGEIEISGMPGKYSVSNAPAVLPVLLYDYLRIKGYKGVSKDRVESYIATIADENRYNPVRDMFKSNKWDGQDRFGRLCDILGVGAETQYASYLLKWLWQTVAMALNDERAPIGADGVLALQGEQGCGKTRFFTVLAMRPEWFREGMCLDVTDRDSIMISTSAWITELGEVDQTLKRENESLKAFITARTDVYRPPYGRATLKRPRRTSFCATVNPEQFLNDETGSRRFWTIPVQDIDVAALNELPRVWVEQLWQQVYEVYYLQDPGGFRLSAEERTTLQKENENFSKLMVYEEEVRTLLDWSMPRAKWSWWTAPQVSALVNAREGDSRRVGRVLAHITRGRPKDEKKHPRNVAHYLLPLSKSESA